MRTALIIFLLSLLSVFGQAPPYQRQFFDTNTDPVVQVTAGSNAFVTFSTTEPAGQVRTYRVDVPSSNYETNLGLLMGQTQGVWYTTIGRTNYYRSLVGMDGISLITNAENIIITNTAVWWWTNPAGQLQSNQFRILSDAEPATGSISNNFNVGIKGLLALYGTNGSVPFIEFRNMGVPWSNTFVGRLAGASNLNGVGNTFIGHAAGERNSNASYSTYVGASAGEVSYGGPHNTAVGNAVLKKALSTTGQNTVVGSQAMREATTAQNNIAIGYQSLGAAINTPNNVVVGASVYAHYGPLGNNVVVGNGVGGGWTNAGWNTAIGDQAMYVAALSAPQTNVAVGHEAGQGFTQDRNTAIGAEAMRDVGLGMYNTSVGFYSGRYLRQGSNNLFLGDFIGGVDTQAVYLNSNIMIGVGGRLKAKYDGTNDWQFEPSLSTPIYMSATNGMRIGYPTMTPFTNWANTNSFESTRIPATNITFRFLVPSNVVSVVYTNLGFPYSNVFDFDQIKTNALLGVLYITNYGTTGDALINVPFYTASASTNAPAWNEFVTKDYVDTHGAGGATNAIANINGIGTNVTIWGDQYNTNYMQFNQNGLAVTNALTTDSVTVSGDQLVMTNANAGSLTYLLLSANVTNGALGGTGTLVIDYHHQGQPKFYVGATNGSVGSAGGAYFANSIASGSNIIATNNIIAYGIFAGDGSGLSNVSMVGATGVVLTNTGPQLVGGLANSYWQIEDAGGSSQKIEMRTNYVQIYRGLVVDYGAITSSVSGDGFVGKWLNGISGLGLGYDSLITNQIVIGNTQIDMNSSVKFNGNLDIGASNYVLTNRSPFLDILQGGNPVLTLCANYIEPRVDITNAAFDGTFQVKGPTAVIDQDLSVAANTYLDTLVVSNLSSFSNSIGLYSTDHNNQMLLNTNGTIWMSNRIANAVPLRIDRFVAGQTTNLFEIYSNNVPLFIVKSNGVLHANGNGVTNITPTAIVSNGTYLVNGVLATNSGVLGAGAFLQEIGVNRAYSFNGSGLTNLNASALASGTVPTEVLTNATLNVDRLVPVQMPLWVVFEGDSLTAGSGGLDSYATLVTNLDIRFVQSTNLAVGGETIVDMDAAYATNAATFAPSGGTNAIFSLWAGATSFGQTVAQFAGYWSNLVSNARADGFKIVAFTILPTTNYPAGDAFDFVRMAKNDYIRYSGLWDWLIDVAAMFPDPHNSTYFNVDGVHLTAAAQTNVANVWLNAMRQSPQMPYNSAAEFSVKSNATFSVVNEIGTVLLTASGNGGVVGIGRYATNGGANTGKLVVNSSDYAKTVVTVWNDAVNIVSNLVNGVSNTTPVFAITPNGSYQAIGSGSRAEVQPTQLTLTNGSNFIIVTNKFLGIQKPYNASYSLMTDQAISSGTALYAGTFVEVQPDYFFSVSAKSRIASAVDGRWNLRNNGNTGFDTLIFGPDSASWTSTNWPALRVSESTNTVSLTLQRGTNNSASSGVANLRVTGSITATNTVTATNFTLLTPQWIDIPVTYAHSTLGPSTPVLVATRVGGIVKELAFDHNAILYGQSQFPHNLATTNANFPNFYFEPHVHFSVTNLPAGQSNVVWQCEWEVASINGTYTLGTNAVTNAVTAVYTHYMAELGHITNNPPSGISSVFRCRLTRPNMGDGDYGNTSDVLLDGFDVHVPVGNTVAIGSRTDNSQ